MNKILIKHSYLLLSLLLVSGTLPVPETAAVNVIKFDLVGGDTSREKTLPDTAEAESVYFKKDSSEAADSDITKPRSVCSQVFPGVDLIIYGDGYSIEHVYIIDASADYSSIMAAFSNAKQPEKDHTGTIKIPMENGQIIQSPPVVIFDDGKAKHFLDSAYSDMAYGKNIAFSPGPEFDDQVSNMDFLKFLNDAELHPDKERNSSVFIEQNGSLYFDSTERSPNHRLFDITKSKFVYHPDNPPGFRFSIKDKDKPDQAKYNLSKPVAGVSWYGAAKYCNWLTLASGRKNAPLTYREGSNPESWGPLPEQLWTSGSFRATAPSPDKGFSAQLLFPPGSKIEIHVLYSFYMFPETAKGADIDKFHTPVPGFETAKSPDEVASADEAGDLTAERNSLSGTLHKGGDSETTDDQDDDQDSDAAAGGGDTSVTPQIYYTVTISSEPGSGATIISLPADVNGNYYGTTPGVSFIYAANSSIILIASQTTSDGSEFDHWETDDGKTYKSKTDDGKAYDSRIMILTITRNISLTAVYKTPSYTLEVTSLNPDSGITISVETEDINGDTDGTTSFTREYEYGTSVTLTAPSTSPEGNIFYEWRGSDGMVYDSLQITVTMSSDVTYTAVYEPPVTLSVNAENTSGGITISVSQGDLDGQTDGTTAFTREYELNTVVTLTAPVYEPGGNIMYGWRDGDGNMSLGTEVTVTMSSDKSYTAVYRAPNVLTVNIENSVSGATIGISPDDINQQSDGDPSFTREYAVDTQVTLTAPANDNSGNSFSYWRHSDGTIYTSREVTITMGSDITMTAVFTPLPTLTVEADNTAGAVTITVSPADENGNGDGNTTFIRTYISGTTVTLTAPATESGGNLFGHWESSDGTTYPSGDRDITVTINDDVTLTAVYITPPVLTVASHNPATGVPITVTPSDLDANGDDNTTFTRRYESGTTVSLTAPSMEPGGNIFSQWHSSISGAFAAGDRDIDITITADVTLTAIYVTPVILTVEAPTASGPVGMTISPTDVDGSDNGNTTFTRRYVSGTSISLTAPNNEPGGLFFLRWSGSDGSTYPIGDSDITFSITADITMTAEYVAPVTVTINSQDPNSGVDVTTSSDVDGNGGTAQTSFARRYLPGDTINLTAMQTAPNGNTFYSWSGSDGSTYYTRSANIIVPSSDVTYTAIYVPPWQLNVESFNPNSGIAITVSPNDISGDGSDNTAFTRFYNHGTSVTLTAPQETASATRFYRWSRSDGTTYSTRNVTFTMDNNYTMTAEYQTLRYLRVNTSIPGEGVLMTPSLTDVYGNNSQPTAFTFTYLDGQILTLTAPTVARGLTFQKWQVGGVDVTTNRVTPSITMDADYSYTAYYVYIPGPIPDPDPSDSGI